MQKKYTTLWRLLNRIEKKIGQDEAPVVQQPVELYFRVNDQEKLDQLKEIYELKRHVPKEMQLNDHFTIALLDYIANYESLNSEYKSKYKDFEPCRTFTDKIFKGIPMFKDVLSYVRKGEKLKARTYENLLQCYVGS